MKLTHPFLYRCHDMEDLFKNVKTLSQFKKKLQKQSQMYPERYSVEKYLGDGWEFFCEALIKTHQYDNRIGILNYRPVIKDDNGVDGYGVNIYGKKCAIQNKFRVNNKTLLSATGDGLDSFVTESQKNGILLNEKYCHFVFTTAKGLHHHTDQNKFDEKVKCYGYDDIRILVDNNLHFWNFIKEEMLQLQNNIVSL